MTLSSEKEMTACHLPVSGLPLSSCILALSGIVDGNIELHVYCPAFLYIS